MTKTVKVSDGNHERLTEIGNYGDSMDDIIEKLLNNYENNKGGGSS